MLHENDGSGGNLTSLNYNLESNKHCLQRCETNWERSDTHRKSCVFHFFSQLNLRLTHSSWHLDDNVRIHESSSKVKEREITKMTAWAVKSSLRPVHC